MLGVNATRSNQSTQQINPNIQKINDLLKNPAQEPNFDKRIEKHAALVREFVNNAPNKEVAKQQIVNLYKEYNALGSRVLDAVFNQGKTNKSIPLPNGTQEYSIKKSPADGNCFFHSIISASGSTTTVSRVRHRAAELITTTVQQNTGLTQAEATGLKQNGAWNNNAMDIAVELICKDVADTTKRPVAIIDTQNKATYIYTPKQPMYKLESTEEIAGNAIVVVRSGNHFDVGEVSTRRQAPSQIRTGLSPQEISQLRDPRFSNPLSRLTA